MKLSWFSPLPPDHTEIGNVTARILPALSRAFDIDLYTETQNFSPELQSHCPIIPFNSESIDWKRLNLGGLPIYHIGNNIHFHGEIISVARRCPGIVVLHDLSLHETILNLCLRKGPGRAGYFDILQKYGGAEAVERGKAFLDQRSIDTNTLSVEYPLFEYVLENAAGVITHNPLNAEIVRLFTPAPILYAPLPYKEREGFSPFRRRKARKSRPYEILIFGFLGSSNRRLQPFLSALASSPARDRFNVTLAGTYPEKDVKKWIRSLGLVDRVKLRGYVSDEELDKFIEASDLTPNLRWPSRGESSGTLLRIWNYSLPALVTDTAFYSTLPRNSVAFVDPADEHQGIRSHLEAFADNPLPYFAMGEAGHEYLTSQHSVEAFVGHLQEFIPKVLRWRGKVYPQVMGRSLTRDFIADYPAAEARSSLLEKVAAEVVKWS